MILSCSNISKSFGEKHILKQVSFHLEDHEKAAIVGINGAGKSTLLKIIIGELASDEGCVALGRGASIGYLAQHQDLDSESTIHDALLEVKRPILQMEERIRTLELDMKSASGESLEAMQAVGAGRLTTISQVILPACLPGFLSWLLYSLEVNIRSSTLVGAVGGGGIGLIMMGYIKQFRYQSAMGVILLIAFLVILVDLLTNYLRKKVLSV